MSAADDKPAANKKIEDLLPGSTVILWYDEGFLAHQTEYARTAASQALSETGIFTAISQALQSLVPPTAESSSFPTIVQFADHIMNHGFAVSVSLTEGETLKIPQLTVVLPNLNPLLEAAAKDAKPDDEAEADGQPTWTSRTIGDRTVWSFNMVEAVDLPGNEVQAAYWAEGPHMVIVVGWRAVDNGMLVVKGAKPNLASHPLWQELQTAPTDFSRRSCGWVDIAALKNAYGDQPVFPEAIEGMGLEELLFFPLALFGTVVEAHAVPVDALPQVQAVEGDVEFFEIPASAPPVVIGGAETGEPYGEPINAPVRTLVPPLEPDAAADDETGTVRPFEAAPKFEVRGDPPAFTESAPEEEADAPVEEGIPPNFVDEDALLKPPPAAAEPETPPITINQALEVVGLDSVEHWTWQAGYRGRSQWSESSVKISGPRKGFLRFGSRRQMSLEDLPPLPAQIGAFSATTLELDQLVLGGADIVRKCYEISGPENADDFDEMLKAMQQQVPAEIYLELLASLDNVICFYNDDTNGPLTFGPVLAWKVKDAPRLRKAIDRLLETPVLQAAVATETAVETTVKTETDIPPATTDEAAPEDAELPPPAKPEAANDHEQAPVAPQILRQQRYGREFISVNNSLGVLVIDDNWLVVALNTQLLDAFVLRVDGKLPRWKPSAEHQEAFRDLPAKFNSISIDDPRRTLPFWYNMAPLALSTLKSISVDGASLVEQTAATESPQDQFVLPPAELVVQPLFPNVTMQVSDDQGTKVYARTSLPSPSFWTTVPITYLSVMLLIDGEDLLDIF